MKPRDLRVESIRPLLPPAILLEELPLSEDASQVITRARDEVAEILAGSDDRLIVIVGPCSVHDPAAAGEYARRLKTLSDELAADLRIVMRVYFEKPRTTVGWKGLINDPRLDGTFAINDGLRKARHFLLDLADMGLPVGGEFLDPISPQYTSDTVSWGAIGARTTESQVHRELASGMSMPIGFKNGTDGGVQIAIDAVRAIVGMMMESFLVDGRQDLVDPNSLRYGQSITDACMGWDMTVPVLAELAEAVRTRRTRT